MNIKFLIAVLIIVIAISFNLKPLAIYEYPINVEFVKGKTVGVTGTKDLNFGRQPIGTKLTRHIVLENKWNVPITIVQELSGNVTPFTTLVANWTLNPGEEADLKVIIESSTEEGIYSGYLKLVVKS